VLSAGHGEQTARLQQDLYLCCRLLCHPDLLHDRACVFPERDDAHTEQFAAIFLAVKGIINVTDASKAEGNFDPASVFTNPSASRFM
jgi:hypothetical protein